MYGSRRGVCARSLDGVPTRGEEECVYISRGQDGGWPYVSLRHAGTHHSLPYKTHARYSGMPTLIALLPPMQKYELEPLLLQIVCAIIHCMLSLALVDY